EWSRVQIVFRRAIRDQPGLVQRVKSRRRAMLRWLDRARQPCRDSGAKSYTSEKSAEVGSRCADRAPRRAPCSLCTPSTDLVAVQWHPPTRGWLNRLASRDVQ